MQVEHLFYTSLIQQVIGNQILNLFTFIKMDIKKGKLSDIFKIFKSPSSLELFKKEALAQVFSCKFCQIFRNTFLHRTPSLLLLSRRVFDCNRIYKNLFYHQPFEGLPIIINAIKLLAK